MLPRGILVTKEIVFISPRGFGLEPEFRKVFDRLKGALENTFRNVSDPTRVYFFVGCSENDSILREKRGHSNEIVCFRFKTRNFFRYLLKVFKELKILDSRPDVLIAGDPRLGFFASYLLGFRFKSSRIQTQIHGNSQNVLGSVTLPSWIRKIYVDFLVKNSNSLRMVSNHQKISYETLIGRSISNVVIAPVPFHVPTNRFTKTKSSVGFVGRMHGERGLQNWIDIATKVSDLNAQIDFIMIGDGPARIEFSKKLQTSTKGKASFLGWLTQDQLEAQWRNIGLLLSTAESESYGVALREALCAGIHVVAYENSATVDLQFIFPEYCHISDDISELARFVVEFTGSRISQKEIDRIRDFYISKNSEALIHLGESWSRLINSH